MDLSKIKLIATDMDGTLLNSNHEVSPLFFELFKELKKHKILFVAASGRPYYSIVEKLHSIKDDIIIVAENGGIVVKQETLLLSTPVKKDNLSKVESIVDSNNHIHAVFCTQSRAYFKNASNGFIKLLSEYYPNFTVINRIADIKEEIIKIALYHNKDSEKYIYPFVKELESDYKLKISGKNWLDISDNLANKGHALKLLQKTYNISKEETLVFGDYNNDLEMLQLASYSFAMENAHPNVKKITNFETKSNDDFGVELILKKLIESKKS